MLPGEFENKERSNNQSVKKVPVEYLTMINNTRLKVTGFLTDAGNRKDLAKLLFMKMNVV